MKALEARVAMAQGRCEEAAAAGDRGVAPCPQTSTCQHRIALQGVCVHRGYVDGGIRAWATSSVRQFVQAGCRDLMRDAELVSNAD